MALNAVPPPRASVAAARPARPTRPARLRPDRARARRAAANPCPMSLLRNLIIAAPNMTNPAPRRVRRDRTTHPDDGNNEITDTDVTRPNSRQRSTPATGPVVETPACANACERPANDRQEP